MHRGECCRVRTLLRDEVACGVDRVKEAFELFLVPLSGWAFGDVLRVAHQGDGNLLRGGVSQPFLPGRFRQTQLGHGLQGPP